MFDFFIGLMEPCVHARLHMIDCLLQKENYPQGKLRM